jgi:hypothetical protein
MKGVGYNDKLFTNNKAELLIIINCFYVSSGLDNYGWDFCSHFHKEVSFLGWSEKITTQNKGAIFLLDVGTFVFGKVPEPLFDLTTSLAGAIIIMSLLGIMLGLIFGDVFKNFSSLTPWVSYSLVLFIKLI